MCKGQDSPPLADSSDEKGFRAFLKRMEVNPEIKTNTNAITDHVQLVTVATARCSKCFVSARSEVGATAEAFAGCLSVNGWKGVYIEGIETLLCPGCAQARGMFSLFQHPHQEDGPHPEGFNPHDCGDDAYFHFGEEGEMDHLDKGDDN